MNGAQAEGCSPVARGVRRRRRRLPPGQARHDRQVAGDRQPRRRSIRARPRPHDRRRRSTPSPTTRSAHGIKLLAETTGIFTETAGGVTTATLAKLAERGDIAAGERVVLVITGEGLKTLDAVRGTFESYEVDPVYASFEQNVTQAVQV